MISARGTCL